MVIKICLLLSVFVIPFAAYFAFQSFYAPLRGIIKTESIYGKTKIIYESEYGIPYITGDTNESVFFGQGFVHAADRLLELQIKRLFTSGRLSEVCVVV